MKNFKFFALLLLLAIGLPLIQSCTDLVVKEKDSTVVTSTGGVFTGDPTALLAGVYTSMDMFADQANIYALYEHTTDEMIPPTRGTDWGDNGVWRTLHAHTWDATHSQIRDTWNNLNSRAFKCNQVLAANPSAGQKAEAQFLRALFMFHVMDLFGQVPFRNVDDGVNVDPKVLSRSDAFDFILKDLTEALPNLPDLSPSAGDNTKASKAAANTLLARLYLNKAVYKAARPEGPYAFDNGDMDKVISYCDAVTAAGFTLETNYFDNFKASAKNEIIFADPAGTPQNRVFMTLHYQQNPSGWNGFTTLADFYDKFDAADQRKGHQGAKDGTQYQGVGYGFLEGQQYNDDGTKTFNQREQRDLSFTRDVPLAGAATDKGIRVMKYHMGEYGKYILFRYGDVVTMKAEAQLRKGDAPGALATLNILRAVRAPSLPLTSIDLNGMLDERGREMYWESVRRMDLVRYGKFADTWGEKTVTEAFRVLFPIPQQALDSNPNLTQNTGY